MNNPEKRSNVFYCYRQNTLDYIFLSIALIFISLLSMFPIRNNDIWWHMAVGREIIRSGGFIHNDIFSFSNYGHPWVPHSYLAGLIFYAIYTGASAYGLIIFRIALVLGTFLSLARIAGRKGIPYTILSPFMILAALCIHPRLMIRPYLFEYFFIAILLRFLLIKPKMRLLFYIIPVLLQIAWVNMHSSFFLGPLIVLLFLSGETLAFLLSKLSAGFKSPWREKFEWKPLLALFFLLIISSLINPSPKEFFFHPFSSEQTHLILKYTMEWLSPFDPIMKTAPFHPYYEILLFLALASFVLGITRIHISSLLIMGLFAVLSLKAHRFRVEFAISALPLMLVQLKASKATGLFEGLLKRKRGALLAAMGLFAVLLSGFLILSTSDRIKIDASIEDRYPIKAFDFVRGEKIAKHSFHSIGFGSFLIWDLYPQRKSFIDGRSLSSQVYSDFLECQSNVTGFKTISGKYKLDAFILPVPEKCDKGLINVHNFLIRSRLWNLVYMDRIAFIYVKKDEVPENWLEQHAFKFYHTMTFAKTPFLPSQVDSLIHEIRRAVANDPSFLSPWVDLGAIYMNTKQYSKAMEAYRRAIELSPTATFLWYRSGIASFQAGDYGGAVDAFKQLVFLSPDEALSHFHLGRAFEEMGKEKEAIEEYELSLTKDRNFVASYVRIFEVHSKRKEWSKALEIATKFHSVRPYDYRGSYQQGLSYLRMNKLDRAMEKAIQAKEFGGDYAVVHVLLADIFYEKRDFAKARVEIEKALNLEPGNSDALRLSKALEKIEM